MKFLLTIEMGNEAMRTPEDVAEALMKVGTKLARRESDGVGVISDANGNTVGKWFITEGVQDALPR